MLPYILAIAVASASFLLWIVAFAFPKLHRQDDFLWSGIGLFYALVLWLCAGRLTGGVLLGQGAATCLLLAFGWQTLKLRRAIAYPESQTDLEGFSVTRWLGSRFSKAPRKPATPTVATAVTETQEVKATAQEEVVEAIAETTEERPAAPAKPGLLSNIFGSRQPSAAAKPTSLTTALDEADLATEEFEEDWEPEEIPEATAIAEIAEPVVDTDLATEEFESEATAIAETAEPVEEVEVVVSVAVEEREVAIKEVSCEAETNAPATVEESAAENSERQDS